MHTPERCQGLKIVGGELRAHQLDCSMESCRAPLPRPCLEHLGWRCGSSSSSSSRPPSPNLRPRTTETPHLYSAPWLLKETGACTEKAARHKTLAGPARGAVRAGGRTPRAARAGRRREGERARPPGCAPCLQDEHDEDEQDEDEDQRTKGEGGEHEEGEDEEDVGAGGRGATRTPASRGTTQETRGRRASGPDQRKMRPSNALRAGRSSGSPSAHRRPCKQKKGAEAPQCAVRTFVECQKKHEN
ncbi:unnamed protein product [Prorocentrum cordatum]|uniref:Uncharacterized protein n=1 Tax=Prorocentrum cordatum TaxID=2364126 RepID=A0ABN9V9D2_9DINO|nr:unnamed protein product [Polarella glacialis]